MKITIDETNKIISFEGKINLQELINWLTQRNLNLEEYCLYNVSYTPSIPSGDWYKDVILKQPHYDSPQWPTTTESSTFGPTLYKGSSGDSSNPDDLPF